MSHQTATTRTATEGAYLPPDERVFQPEQNAEIVAKDQVCFVPTRANSSQKSGTPVQ